jgi:6-phosphogluconolactonase
MGHHFVRSRGETAHSSRMSGAVLAVALAGALGPACSGGSGGSAPEQTGDASTGGHGQTRDGGAGGTTSRDASGDTSASGSGGAPPHDGGTESSLGGSDAGDAATGDAGNATTTVVGPAGGTATGPYGAELTIPAGALAAPIDVTIARDGSKAPAVALDDIRAAGSMYEITPHGAAFSKPATVRIPFDTTQIPGDAVPALYEAEPGGTFAEIPTTIDGSMLVADVTSLSWFFPAYTASRPRNVYVGVSQGIASYKITKSTGVLTGPIGTATAAYPSALAVHPSGRFLFSASRNPNLIGSYKLDTVTGSIASGATNTQPTSPLAGVQGPVGVVVHPSGKFVYSVNYGQGPGGNTDLTVFQIDGATGALSAPRSTADSGGAPTTGLAFDPSGKFAYVTYGFKPFTPVGNKYTEQVEVFSVDGTTGDLTGPLSGVPSGSSPWAIAVDRLGQFAYVAAWGGDEIRIYRIDGPTGALTYWTSQTVQSRPSSLAVDSMERFLYVGKETPTSNVNLEPYTVDATTGALASATAVLVGGGLSGMPINVVAEPKGEFVYALSSGLTGFKVDATTGNLSSIGTVPGVGGPASPGSVIAASGPSPVWRSDCTTGCFIPSVRVTPGGPVGPGPVPPPSATHFLDVTRQDQAGKVVSTPSGITCGDPLLDICGAEYPAGAGVRLCVSHSDPNPYDVFWTGACLPDVVPQCAKVWMTSDKSCHVELRRRTP